MFDPSTPSSITVMEDATVNDVLYNFTATDADGGATSAVTFDAAGDSIGVYFEVASNGSMELIASLDRETDSEYNITVMVSDSAPSPFHYTTNKSITIVVGDINDNPPTFAESEVNFTIGEDSQIGAALFNVSADDLDDGENARIVYEIVSNTDTSGLFEIDPNTGVFSLNGKF